MKLELQFLCEEVRKTEILSPIYHLSELVSSPSRQDCKECCHVTLRPLNNPKPNELSGVIELRNLTPKQAKGFNAGKTYTVTVEG